MSINRYRSSLSVLAAALLCGSLHAGVLGPDQKLLASVAMNDQISTINSSLSDLSRKGRFLAYGSYSPNKVEGDTNGEHDIFVRDSKKGVTRRVSVGTGGVEANGSSRVPRISANGRFVIFLSDADNLAPGDDNGLEDVFLHDRKKGRTELISVGLDGSVGNGRCLSASVSDNGRFVAFESKATNLVTGGLNGDNQIFLRDRKKQRTRLISANLDGEAGNAYSVQPHLSANGRYVVFSSSAYNLLGDGVDTNFKNDIFRFDRKTGDLRRVSIDLSGGEADSHSFEPGVSSNGRFVVFSSTASDLIESDHNGLADIFVRDVKKNRTVRVSQSASGVGVNDVVVRPRISDNGRAVVFESSATNLLFGLDTGAYHIYSFDRKHGTLNCVSLAFDGTPSDGQSNYASVSPKGGYISFMSNSRDLLDVPVSGVGDVFLHRSY